MFFTSRVATVLLSLVLVGALFEPYFIREYIYGVLLTDLLVLLFLFITLFSQLLVFRLNKNSVLFLSLLFGFIVLTVFQYLKFDLTGRYIFDIFKLAKLFLFLIVLGANIDITCFIKRMLAFYIIADVVFSLIQMLYPNIDLFGYFSFGTHLNQISSRPFGFMENSTQAGFVALLILYVFEVLKIRPMIYLCLLSILLHTNKMSILVGFSVHLYFYYKNMQYISYNNLFKLLLILPASLFAFCLAIVLSPNVYSFVIRSVEFGVEGNATYYIRLHNIMMLYEVYRADFLGMFFLGFPLKEFWPDAFDNQYILLNYRYGFVGLLSIYTLLLYFLRRDFILFLIMGIASLTMINFYHLKASLLVSLVIYFIIYNTSKSESLVNSKCSSVIPPKINSSQK